MAPTLFSKFIPNILPPAVESELSEYAAQDQKLQRELIQNGFTRQVITFQNKRCFLSPVWSGEGDAKILAMEINGRQVQMQEVLSPSQVAYSWGLALWQPLTTPVGFFMLETYTL